MRCSIKHWVATLRGEICSPCGPTMGPVWAHMGPCGRRWLHIALIWPIISWAHMGEYGASMGPYGPKMGPCGPIGTHMGRPRLMHNANPFWKSVSPHVVFSDFNNFRQWCKIEELIYKFLLKQTKSLKSR